MKRMKCVFLAMMLLLTGCSTVQVSQDYRDTDFSRYRSYTWKTVTTGQEPNGTLLDNPLLHERFHKTIDKILALRGYSRKEPADFLVSYTFSIETRLESYPYGPRVGVGAGRRYRYGEIGFGYLDINQYQVGILAVNFYDAASETVIWRGIGSERVDLHSTPEKTTELVDRLVSAVLSQFPPR